MEKVKILVIDDDDGIRTQMKWALNEEYNVILAKDTDEALSMIDQYSPPLVTLDLGLPPDPEGTEEGFRLLHEILKASPLTKVIVVSGNPEKDAPLRAISMGALDFFSKPINIEELKAVVKRARYVQGLERENKLLQTQLEADLHSDIIGSSQEIRETLTSIKKVASSDICTLITGESGTGKELVAREIHTQSHRKDEKFVAINCGAIPENLMESEFFGHEKGAFTGAHTMRRGKLELADKGTVFLDEVGDLPLALQVKLLRVLQEHTMERVGGRKTIELDIRFLAATNRDLEEMVCKGDFREDLFYRLAVVTIDIPSLSARGNDALVLANSFLKKYAKKDEKSIKLSESAIVAINNYDWPGNVRELENKIQRAIAFASGGQITALDLGFDDIAIKSSLNLKNAKEEIERKYIKTALVECSGNISRAAQQLGTTRPTLHSLIKKYNINTKEKIDN